MLVLSRKIGERIHIGNNIVVEVLDVRGNKVRLGVAAPKDISVDRAEVYHAKQRVIAVEAVAPNVASVAPNAA